MTCFFRVKHFNLRDFSGSFKQKSKRFKKRKKKGFSIVSIPGVGQLVQALLDHHPDQPVGHELEVGAAGALVADDCLQLLDLVGAGEHLQTTRDIYIYRKITRGDPQFHNLMKEIEIKWKKKITGKHLQAIYNMVLLNFVVICEIYLVKTNSLSIILKKNLFDHCTVQMHNDEVIPRKHNCNNPYKYPNLMP